MVSSKGAESNGSGNAAAQNGNGRGSHHQAVAKHEKKALSQVAVELNVKPDDERLCYNVFRDHVKDENVPLAPVSKLVEMLEACEVPCDERTIKNLCRQVRKDADGLLDFEDFMTIYVHTPTYLNRHAEELFNSKTEKACRGLMDGMQHVKKEVKSPSGVIKAYVKDEINQMRSCMQLPAAMLILLSYCACCYVHDLTNQVHAMEQTLWNDVMHTANFASSGDQPFDMERMGFKNLVDVNSVADFWSWMSLGIVPLFFSAEPPLSEARANAQQACKTVAENLVTWGWDPDLVANVTMPGRPSDACPSEALHEDASYRTDDATWNDGKNQYLRYMQILGGMRVRQERMDIIPCRAEDTSYRKALHNGKCVSVDPHRFWAEPGRREFHEGSVEMTNRPGGETFIIRSHTPIPEVRQILRQKENQRWFSYQTGKIEVTVPLFNEHMDVVTIISVVLFMNQAGHIYKWVQPAAFWNNPYHGWWAYAVDAVWMATIVRITFQELWEIIGSVGKFGFRFGMRKYVTFTGIVDWLNVFYAVGLWIVWILHLGNLRNLRVFLNKGILQEPGTWASQDELEAFFEEVDSVRNFYELLRLAATMYPFLVVARIFKAFSAQPRLSLVTVTIQQCAVGLIHFVVVFISIFSVFVVGGFILFGRDMAEFATLGRATHYCFMTLLGAYAWKELAETSRTVAGVWLCIFIVLVQMMMLNMLLSIVMDAYTEVKGTLGSQSETLWSQAYEIFKRWYQRQKGQRVSLNHVLKYLEEFEATLEEETEITESQFIAIVPGLEHRQAKRVITNSIIRFEQENRANLTLSSGLKSLKSINVLLESIMRMTRKHMDMMDATRHLLTYSAQGRTRNDTKPRASPRATGTTDPFASASNGLGMPALLNNFWEKHTQTVMEKLDSINVETETQFRNMEDELLRLAPLVSQLNHEMRQQQEAEAASLTQRSGYLQASKWRAATTACCTVSMARPDRI
mmetsp:Transcript_103260/g.266965  ORF Transcript_103260/g.266965 Transcript_103260/m.266965 type:complete len:971 (-) Transcript_103260:50-2962(-)